MFVLIVLEAIVETRLCDHWMYVLPGAAIASLPSVGIGAVENVEADPCHDQAEKKSEECRENRAEKRERFHSVVVPVDCVVR